MGNKQEMMEQLQLEMIIALENNDEELYLELLIILKKLRKEIDKDEDEQQRPLES